MVVKGKKWDKRRAERTGVPSSWEKKKGKWAKDSTGEFKKDWRVKGASHKEKSDEGGRSISLCKEEGRDPALYLSEAAITRGGLPSLDKKTGRHVQAGAERRNA